MRPIHELLKIAFENFDKEFDIDYGLCHYFEDLCLAEYLSEKEHVSLFTFLDNNCNTKRKKKGRAWYWGYEKDHPLRKRWLYYHWKKQEKIHNSKTS